MNNRDLPAKQVAPRESLITASHVVKRYATQGMTVPVLHDVSLTVARGEMIAIMGQSGSGKSTLLNCLAGLESIDGGAIVIDGVDIATLNDHDLTAFRGKTMGFVFQNFNLLPVLDAIENVELPLLLTHIPATEARARAQELLGLVQLDDRAHHRPAELSGGQRQRVALARALITRPAILWADEPTGNLDTESAALVIHLLRDANRTQGQTIVLVTHSHSLADQLDRTITLRDGRIVDAS